MRRLKMAAIACCLASGTSTPALCAPKSAPPAPRTTEECMNQWRSLMSDPRPDNKGNGLPPDEMCQNSKKLPADEGRCKKIIEEVLKAYTDAETSVKSLCALVPRAYESRCNNQGDCQAGTSEFQKEYAAAIDRHNKNVRSLITRMDEMAKLGLNTSEQFAHDLQEMKSSIDFRMNTETSRRHGGATIADALRNHSGQDVETVMRILDHARKTSEISQAEIEQTIKSPYIFETLQASAVALDQKRDLEAYSRNLAQQSAEAQRISAVAQSSTNDMNSINGSTDGITLPSSLPGMPTASPGAVAGGLAIPAYQAGAFPSENEIAAPGTRAGNALASTRTYGEGVGALGAGTSLKRNASDGATVAQAKADSANDGSAASSNAPGTAKPKESLREALRLRMAKRGSASGDDFGAEATSGSKRKGGYALGPDGKPLVGASELDPNDPNAGRMPPMMMQNSETEGAVRAMVDDFERSLGGGRGPASVSDVANDILPSNTPSLFLRLKEVHVRCVKRGCVGQTRGKESI